MMKKKRIEFLSVTWIIFVVYFAIYGLTFQTFIDNLPFHPLGLGLLAGYGFSSILCGIILFVRFITKKSLIFKMLCSCFFIITLAVICYVGIFSFLPYSIYNIYKIIQNNEPS